MVLKILRQLWLQKILNPHNWKSVNFYSRVWTTGTLEHETHENIATFGSNVSQRVDASKNALTLLEPWNFKSIKHIGLLIKTNRIRDIKNILFA